MSGAHSRTAPQGAPTENPEDRRARWISASRWTLVGIATWIALLRFPTVPDAVSTEDGWKWALGLLLERRGQVGAEWIFTYGPLGYFLQTAYVPGLFAARWIFECAMKGALAFLAVSVLRRERSVGVRAAAIAALVAIPASDDGAFGELGVVLAGLELLGGGTEVRWRKPTIALFLAVLALAKFSLLVLATGAAGAVAWHLCATGRTRGAIAWAASFLAAIALAWTLAGQSLSNVPRYLAAAFDLARHYSDAMSLEGPRLELLAGILVLGCLAAAILARPGLPKAGVDRLRGALLLFALLLAFKEGFTRHDVLHAARWFAFALAAAPLVLVAVPSLDGRAPWRRGLLVVAALVASLSLARALRTNEDGRETWPDPLSTVSAGLRGLTRPLDLRDRLEERLEARRADSGFPLLAPRIGREPVAVLGNFQILALLSGLEWSPRYCFQSYAAFTDDTVARNADALSGDGAPRYLLVDGRVIDQRYPTVEDCGSVLRALQGYRPVGGERGFLLLERQARDAPPVLRTVRVRLRPGETCDLPGEGRAVLARIRCEKTLRGAATSALLRTPVLELRIELRDGTVLALRALPSLATSSFLLSPLLPSLDAWIDAYVPASPRADVVRFRLLEHGGGGCFEAFEVELDLLPDLTGIGIGEAEARELHARVRDR